jgi:hypothetical protein
MMTAAFVLSGVLFQVQALKSKEKGCPYVLVTTSGERIGTLDLPKRDGKPVKFRLCANGTLTMFPSADVDWGATEKANASGPAPTLVPTPVLAPTPTPQVLSGIANKMLVRDAEGLVKQNENSGKLKTASGKEILFEGRNFFGKDSVASYLELGDFLANTSSCPTSRAVAYGVVKNISRMKLRELKAYVVIGSLRTGQNNGQIQTMDPSNLMPGEEAKIFLYLTCDFTTKSGYYPRGDNSIVVFLPDVSGKAEELEKPGATSPFEAAAGPSSRSSPPVPTAPTAKPH